MTRAPVIIGAGLAGLVTALRCAERGDPVVVLSAGKLGVGAASGWAQGGLAAVVGSHDAPGLPAAGTIAAGAGLCDPDVVEEITAAAPEAVDHLTGLGARFDRHTDRHTAVVVEHVSTTLAGALAGVADSSARVDVPEPILEGVGR